MPEFDETFSGLGIMVHGIQKSDVYLTNFNIDESGNYKFSLQINMYDDFGLSKQDVMKFQNKNYKRIPIPVPHMDGLKAWWILQHQRNIQPFVTEINTSVSANGFIGLKIF